MRCLLLSALALTVSLTACNHGDEEANAEQAVVARTSETDLPAWLTHSDGTDPGRWLAGREAGHPLALNAPQVQAMRGSLARAAEGFVEDRRMIANRTVQLGQMLGEVGKDEAYGTLLDGFAQIAAPRGRHKSLYGEMCQHYFNIRTRGLGHEATLAELSVNEMRPLTRSTP
ncbi:MxaH protein [Methylobacterium sp. J-067]|uniref:MxaH protein n=1 Tax=Methylobacterium sp. J-067 TaxID=2836648 RepID=UPI001FB96863|nr:MxaH protein [Methylobacterium sp. J-067]MCJ2023174.1 MxaH protein [Methylobacterium sp. J-067]